MDSKDGTTTHMDTSVPDYDLSLSNSDDAAVLGMIIITCQGPSLTLNKQRNSAISRSYVEIFPSSKFLQLRSVLWGFCLQLPQRSLIPFLLGQLAWFGSVQATMNPEQGME